MTQVSILAATDLDAPVLRRLGEFYAYDFSEMIGDELRDDATFGHDFFSLRPSDPTRRAYLIRVAAAPAGFAIAARGSRLSGDPTVADVAEFFVVRRHRRRGVGAAAAAALFATHLGPWEVRQTPANAAAREFWRAVIGRYTFGQFEEETYDDERWRGTVQRFVPPRGH